MPLNWRKWVFLFPLGKAVRYPNRGCYATTSCTWLITLTALFPRLTAPSEQSLANEAFKCSWLCLWRFNTGFPCMYVTVTAATQCPLQPVMSPELDGGNTRWRAMGRIGEEWQSAQKMQPASKMEGLPHTPRNTAAMVRPSETLSHQHCRPTQTSSGAHLPIRRNTLITPQLLPPAGMGTARTNLPTGICKKGWDENDSPG